MMCYKGLCTRITFSIVFHKLILCHCPDPFMSAILRKAILRVTSFTMLRPHTSGAVARHGGQLLQPLEHGLGNIYLLWQHLIISSGFLADT